ncbi:acyl carrier protein [Streptomyces sp. HD]|uniref:acyl carrier protein n=1 Tax=Streptomyces sp. HD TaxID=3020892 RepID=UPI00232E4191|nr:acyl carrier protein [Streptomyces sp. HD]MDC0772614.1 acyl carrier protein [Streptomyces sp. HD]
MSQEGPFTLDDLVRILLAGAGETEPVTHDASFEELGYDSLALLETYTRIERELGIELDDEVVPASLTPAQLVTAVNARLASAQSA